MRKRGGGAWRDGGRPNLFRADGVYGDRQASPRPMDDVSGGVRAVRASVQQKH